MTTDLKAALAEYEKNSWGTSNLEVSPFRIAVELLESAREALALLGSKQIATWYDGLPASTREGRGGYYAGWDDAEYAVKKTLATLATHGITGSSEHDSKGDTQ